MAVGVNVAGVARFILMVLAVPVVIVAASDVVFVVLCLLLNTAKSYAQNSLSFLLVRASIGAFCQFDAVL